MYALTYSNEAQLSTNITATSTRMSRCLYALPPANAAAVHSIKTRHRARGNVCPGQKYLTCADNVGHLTELTQLLRAHTPVSFAALAELAR